MKFPGLWRLNSLGFSMNMKWFRRLSLSSQKLPLARCRNLSLAIHCCDFQPTRLVFAPTTSVGMLMLDHVAPVVGGMDRKQSAAYWRGIFRVLTDHPGQPSSRE
jgi:hypothetical protein